MSPSLNTWGWITVIIGVLQLTGGFSLFGGGDYGRIIAVIAAALGAIESLLSVGGAHPFWSVGIFALCVWILFRLIAYRDESRREPSRMNARADRPVARTPVLARPAAAATRGARRRADGCDDRYERRQERRPVR